MKHLTFKNFCIAFVALNIMSVVSTTQMVGGTFNEVSRPTVRTAPHSVPMHAVDAVTDAVSAVSMEIARPAGAPPTIGHEGMGRADPALIAHMFPGEALLPADLPPADAERLPPPADAAPPRHETVKPLAKPAPAKKPRVSDPPGVNWPMLLSIGAMALYARYLAAKMAQTAISQAVDSVKQIAGALGTLGAAVRAPTAKTAPARAPILPKAPAAPAQKTASATVRPRSSTVVRASRWPFAA
jgi:hypothetical protein